MGNKMITVNSLVKKFNSFTAVDGINFDVEKREIFGLLEQKSWREQGAIKRVYKLTETGKKLLETFLG